MTTRYHVAPDTYSDGDDLLSYRQYEAEYGETPAYKWGDDTEQELYLDSKDADVVCMFDTLAEAQEFQAEFGGIILAIDLPEWAAEEGVRMTKVGEGYTAIFDRIPATLGGETVISKVA